MVGMTLCAKRGCDRRAVNWHNGGLSDNFCCLHDGLHEPVVCHCPTARPDDIGQCTRCWRVIVALHPILIPAWPELVDQPIEPRAA